MFKTRKGYFSGKGPMSQVKIPFSRGQSAGNPLYNNLLFQIIKPSPTVDSNKGLWGTSETRREKLTNINRCSAVQKNRSFVSIHRPRTQKPKEKQFGYFLAGLIDSNGHFNNIPQLVISFHCYDIHLAYFIKSSIGFGIVKLEKKKLACRYVLAHQTGLIKLITLVRNRLCHREKIQQFNERLISRLLRSRSSIRNFLTTLDPFWLAGFLAGDGCFQIMLLNRKTRIDVRIIIQIHQKDESILKSLCSHFGGYVGYRQSLDTYYYSSVNLSNAAKFIKYLDKAHLVGIKMTQYILWRRAFLIVQEGKHLTLAGLGRIKRIQTSINRLKKVS